MNSKPPERLPQNLVELAWMGARQFGVATVISLTISVAMVAVFYVVGKIGVQEVGIPIKDAAVRSLDSQAQQLVKQTQALQGLNDEAAEQKAFRARHDAQMSRMEQQQAEAMEINNRLLGEISTVADGIRRLLDEQPSKNRQGGSVDG